MHSQHATRILGLNSHRNRSRHKTLFNQPHFVKKSLVKCNMGTFNAKAIPTDTCSRISEEMSPTSEEKKVDMAKEPYHEAVIFFHLSIAYVPAGYFLAVSQVEKICQNPGRAHWDTVKGIFTNISGTA